MPNFRYQVIDATGKKSEGIIDAASIGEATRKLKTDGKYISSLTLDRGAGIANMTIGSPMLNTKDLVLISRQLASLLSAGITVLRALDMLYQQLESKKAKKCIGEVYESVQGGRSLSEAFREQKGVIPNIMISMIAAGEESGRLDEVMERLAEHFQKAQNSRTRSHPQWSILRSLLDLLLRSVSDSSHSSFLRSVIRSRAWAVSFLH